MYSKIGTSLFRIALRLECSRLRSCCVSNFYLRNFSNYSRVWQPSCSVVIFSARNYSQIEKLGQIKPPQPLTKRQVEERVIKAVKAWDRFPSDRLEMLTLEVRFTEDLGFDSLDHVEIVMSLEDEFGFEIPDTETDKFKTPNNFVAYICEREDVYE